MVSTNLLTDKAAPPSARKSRRRIRCYLPFWYFPQNETSNQWRASNVCYRSDRILKDGKPGGLPVQEPNKFSLVINVTAATAVDVEVPLGLMVRADELIE